MIIEEKEDDNPKPKIRIDKEKTVRSIILVFKQATAPFLNALKDKNLLKPLNENKLTQIFVEQIDYQLRKSEYNLFGIKNQYSDVFLGTKGVPDFYFHVLEQGVISNPLFIVESKRLPSQTYKKEYVVGNNKNGGIERYKLGTHGKGQGECGLIGFIEKEDFKYWKTEINNWIIEQLKSDNSWKKTERIKDLETKIDYSYLDSIAYRKKEANLKLHHFWIKLLNN